MCFYRYGYHRYLHVLTHSFPTRRFSELAENLAAELVDRHLRGSHRALSGNIGIDARHVLDEPDLYDTVGNLGSLSGRSEEHTSELQSLMRISYAVFCLKKQIINNTK